MAAVCDFLLHVKSSTHFVEFIGNSFVAIALILGSLSKTIGFNEQNIDSVRALDMLVHFEHSTVTFLSLPELQRRL